MNQSSSGMFTKIFVIVCAVLGILGVAVFALSQFGNKVDQNLTGNIIIWGTLPRKEIDLFLTDYAQSKKTFTAEYQEYSEDEFVAKFINSLADGSAPDLILVPDQVLIPLRSFLQVYDNNLISEADYKSTFVRATHKLFDKNGIVSIPYAIDPLMMYVNLDILQNAGFQRPPQYWSDIPNFVEKVNEFASITQNPNLKAIALGTTNNIKEARSILLSMLLQSKNDVTTRELTWKKEDNRWEEEYKSILANSIDNKPSRNAVVAQDVFVFFSSFANPNISQVYSWSRKNPNDRDLFTAGNLGIYFGTATDKEYIDSKNPNLSYEIATLPLPKNSNESIRSTQYSKVISMGLNPKTLKPILAQNVMNDFTDRQVSSIFIKKYNLAPVHIVDIEIPQQEIWRQQIYKAADRGDIVLEPKPDLFKTVFQAIITSIEGSKLSPIQIIVNAQKEMERILTE